MSFYVGLIEIYDNETKYIISEIDNDYFSELEHFHNKLFVDFYGNSYTPILYDIKTETDDNSYALDEYELHTEMIQSKYSRESLYVRLCAPEILTSLPITEIFSDNGSGDESYHNRFMKFFEGKDALIFAHDMDDSDSDSD